MSTITPGIPAVFESASAKFMAVAMLSSTKAIVCYQDDDSSDDGTACVLDISTNIVTPGTPAVFDGGTVGRSSVAMLSSTKAIVCYHEGNTNTYKTCILDISGSTITPGTAVTFSTNATALSGMPLSVVALSSSQAIVCYIDSDNLNYGTACILDVSGSTITPGTPAVFDAVDTLFKGISAAKLTSTKAIVCWEDADPYYGKCCILNVSGSTITPVAAVTFAAENTTLITVAALTSAQVIVCWRANVSPYNDKSCVLDISGDTITPGAAATGTSEMGTYFTVARLTDTQAVFCLEYSSNGKTCLLDISGSTVTIGSFVTFETGDTSYTSVAALTASDAIVCYRDISNAGYGTACGLSTAIYGAVTEDTTLDDTVWVQNYDPKITEVAGLGDSNWVQNYTAYITEDAGMSDEASAIPAFLTEAAELNDLIEGWASSQGDFTDAAALDDDIKAGFDDLGDLAEASSASDTITANLIYSINVNETLSFIEHIVLNTFVVELVDSIFICDHPSWNWIKAIAESLAITDLSTKILAIPISESLSISDIESNNWDGVNKVTCELILTDNSILNGFIDVLVSDEVDITDATTLVLELVIIDLLAVVDTVANIGIFQQDASETLSLIDIVEKWWEKDLSESLSVTDSALLKYLLLPSLAEALNITETLIPSYKIYQTIAETLQTLDAVGVKQLLQELITEGLNLEVVIEVNGELWECWVLNTSAFHPSVYSGYDFNSFCIDEKVNVVYGAKSDGIYKLAGTTDNGTAFRAGIIFPETRFGVANNKRFRKAYLGVDGKNLILKMETESGAKTFRMTDTEVSITRDLKGRKWKFSVEGFDSLDSIDLIPVILSRK